MTSPTHPIEQEELMAYLDGELVPECARKVATHLAECSECRVAVAEFRGISERLNEWGVEPSPPQLAEHVTAAVQENTLKPMPPDKLLSRWRNPSLFGLPRWAWVAAGGVCALFVGSAAVNTYLYRSPQPWKNWQMSQEPAQQAPTPPLPQAITVPTAPMQGSLGRLKTRGTGGGGAPAGIVGGVPGSVATDQLGGVAESAAVAGPMIVRTASVTVLTKEFEKTRAGLEDVLRHHHGYSAELTAGSQTGRARTLSVTYRVPVDQLDAVLAEIKKLGHVEQESQSGEEVTSQYVDLTARLSNARKTEQRLIEILAQRTGKLSDVLAVEEELSRVRGEIEGMEAELKSLQNRVSFATLQVELREEYKAELEITPPSMGTRLRNAVVEGYRSAVDSLVGLVLFLLNVGPFLLLWALILFWPTRLIWRRLRAARAAN